MAMANASSWVRLTKSAACSGSVSNWSRVIVASVPWPSSLSPFMVSSEPRQPSSPSTVTPTLCAMSTTLARDVDVVVVAGDGLAVGLQRAVHHHRAETQVDRALADVRVLAVVLVHDQWNPGVTFDRRQDEVLDERLARVLAGAGTGLQDDRGADLVGGRHHRLHLLEVVDVEGGDPIAVFGGVIQQLAHRDKGHGRGPGSEETWQLR